MSWLLRIVVGSSCIAGSALVLPEPSLAIGRNGHLECIGHVYMFYRNGKCLDARDRPGDVWIASSFNGGDMEVKKSRPCDGLIRVCVRTIDWFLSARQRRT
jgi:hypothetical protein